MRLTVDYCGVIIANNILVAVSKYITYKLCLDANKVLTLNCMTHDPINHLTNKTSVQI